jgi:hypothetical protein
MHIDLQKASLEEKFVLRNLMELCQHDYCEFNGEDVGAFGLFFGYTYLDHYWTDPDHFPFLVRVDEHIAGLRWCADVKQNLASVSPNFLSCENIEDRESVKSMLTAFLTCSLVGGR